jgi:hypothetical protein
VRHTSFIPEKEEKKSIETSMRYFLNTNEIFSFTKRFRQKNQKKTHCAANIKIATFSLIHYCVLDIVLLPFELFLTTTKYL